ncbi:MAG: hypothetical protein BWY53_00785 [Parcubacteria group bacterium ADurb.Bin326]|nr:MAG: hypothetical protein BWY53_00785 [Parcubacteria group bacterium ADurb.Bin326]
MEGYNRQDAVGNDHLYDDNWSSQAFFAEQERLRRKEKINSIIIVVIGLGALIFGLFGMLINISNPFADILKIGQAQLREQAEQERLQLLAMQTTDTDGDGLVDYLEVNKYGTSPYLQDSDADGFSDADEIAKGTNPNCPEGQQCVDTNFISAGGNSSGDVPTLVTEIPLEQGTVAITPDFLRQVLIESGFDQKMLAEVPDSEIIAVFQEYAKTNPEIASKYFNASEGQQVQTSLPAPNASNINLSSLGVKNLEDLKNLSGSQIRTLMVQSGAPEDLLKTVSDEQLKELFLQQLEEKINSNSN